MNYRSILFLVIIGTALLTAGCGRDTFSTVQTTEAAESVSETAQTTDKSTEAYILTFEAKTLEGETLTSDIFSQSRLTMLNIWATYCNPCLSEMPDLGAIAASFDKADFQILGVVSDVNEAADADTIDNALSLVEETQANYPHVLLSQTLYENLVGGIDSVPTTFFINQKGEVLGYVVGAQSKETWEEIIYELLEEQE